MSQSRFDVIILGESFASRIAGALLAKGGCRVLSLREPVAPSSPWFLSSLHLERLLERLDGRSCFAQPTSFQVLTEDSRLEFQLPASVEEELRREFSGSHDQTSEFLRDLNSLGQRLEETLWQCGGLPLLGITSRWRFARQRLRRKLTRRALAGPLENRLAGLRQEPAKRALSALFAGLSLTPVEKLSMAEASLLWSSAVRPEGICPSALDELLRHRYLQFHGTAEKLAGLETLRAEGTRLTGATLKGSGRCEAGFFLLGSPAGQDFLPEALHPAPRPFFQHHCFRSSPLDGMLSPLLADRVILDGKIPMRLSLNGSGHETTAMIECSEGSCPPETLNETVRDTIAQFLPFATFQLERCLSDVPLSASTPSEGSPHFPGTAAPLRLRKNLILCHGGSVLPSLGTTGEVITGMTVANYLLRTIKRGN